MGTVEQPPCCWCGKPGRWYRGSWPMPNGYSAIPLAWCDSDKPDWFVPHEEDSDEPDRN